MSVAYTQTIKNERVMFSETLHQIFMGLNVEVRLFGGFRCEL